MKNPMKIIVVILSLLIINYSLYGNDLADQLAKVGVKNVQNYVTPIFNGFGADLNSGFYHSADLHDILGFDVGIKIALAITKDADKKYTFLTPDSIAILNPTGIGPSTIYLKAGEDYDAEVPDAPTALGSNNANLYVKMLRSKTNPVKQAIYDTLVARRGNNNLFPIPNGFNLPATMLPIPQVALGLPFGIEVIGRFIPTISSKDVGKFNYMGFGIRYDVDQHIPLCPVDIALHLVTQKMNFKSKDDKDVFKATGTAFGAEISKKLVFLTLYGGFQIESSSFTLSQIEGEFKTEFGNIPFTIPETTYKGKNKTRFNAGLRLLLGLFNIHADYSVAKSPVITAGLGVSFR